MDDVYVTDVKRKMIQVGQKKYIVEYFAIEKEKYMFRSEEVVNGRKIGWTEVNSDDPAFTIGDLLKEM